MPVGASSIAAGAGTLFLAATIAGSAFVYDMGAVYISVKAKRPRGDNVRLILPGAIAPVGLWLAPKAQLRDALKDAGPYLPAIQAAADELAACPDSTFIEVVGRQEKVRISKKGSHLVIDVDDANETVHVSVPLETVRAVAARLVAIPPVPSEKAGESAPL